jgi:hypothetical protein
MRLQDRHADVRSGFLDLNRDGRFAPGAVEQGRGGQAMRRRRSILIAGLLLAAAAPSAHGFDVKHLSCSGFLASGQNNMQAIIMWLRGYHAGRSGIIASTDKAEMSAYGERLGQYCKAHPGVGVIQASEQILDEREHGI